MGLRTIEPGDLERKRLIKLAGKGMEGGTGIVIPVLPLDGGEVVGFVADDVRARKVFHMPNPINYAKWALKRYRRMVADALEDGEPVPAWPFPISVRQLSRRVILQRKGIESARLRAAEQQARKVDSGEKVASRSKDYTAYVGRPLVKPEGALPRQDAVSVLEHALGVEIDKQALGVVRAWTTTASAETVASIAARRAAREMVRKDHGVE